MLHIIKKYNIIPITKDILLIVMGIIFLEEAIDFYFIESKKYAIFNVLFLMWSLNVFIKDMLNNIMMVE